MAAWTTSPFPTPAPQQLWRFDASPKPQSAIRPQASREDWDHLEELLEEELAAKGCRGMTHGYARAQNERARVVVVGCNYPQSKRMRLWGACADARQWAQTLVNRLGVPSSNVSLLIDETADGEDVDYTHRSYPSQRNLLEHLAWLTNDAQPGDLLIFVFCGRGTMLLEGADQDDENDLADAEEDATPVEEGLLCADFETADWVNGLSMRMLTSEAVASFWESLSKGVSLTVVLDCEHGMSLLPVPKRLDSSRLPVGIDLSGEPTPVLEVLVPGVTMTHAEARQALRQRSPRDGLPVPSDPKRGNRGSNGVIPERRWLRGKMLWEAAGGEEEPGTMDTEVQAFCLCATGFTGHAYEAAMFSSSSPTQLAPSQRRGVLTHCALQALEEMNFQGSYYALWWRATHIMRREGHRDQHFQLAFAEGTDPTCREVFEPVGAAEARAYDRRAALALEDQDSSKGDYVCSATAWEPRGISPDAPLSARDTTCGCGVFDPRKGVPTAPQFCSLM